MSNNIPLAVAVAFGVAGVIGTIAYTDANRDNRRAEIEIAKARPQYELIVQNLNGNGVPEKFYEVNGRKFFLEIDGKNLEDTLRGD